MLYLPSLVDRHPLEVALLLQKLWEKMKELNYEADCAKYYWRWDGTNPYLEYEKERDKERWWIDVYVENPNSSPLLARNRMRDVYNTKPRSINYWNTVIA